METIRSYVDFLFRATPDRPDKRRKNQIRGGHCLPGDNPIAPQKRMGCLTLSARENFSIHGLDDACPLSISDDEVDDRVHQHQ